MYKQLKAYQVAFELAMEVFEVSKNFPKEERYALTDQVRRSSRAVCANIAEGYRKRIYEKHFVAKLTDADMENTETQVWLDFAFSCNYINMDTKSDLCSKTVEVGKLLGYMIGNPKKFNNK